MAEAAATVGDPDLAAEAYEVLLPYASLPVVAGLGVVCLGSAELPLGLAAAACGRYDEAVDHLGRAVDANRRLGHRPQAVIARAHLARIVGDPRAGASHDPDGAVALLEQAIIDAPANGLETRVPVWVAALRALRSGDRISARFLPETAPSAEAVHREPDGIPRRGVIRQDGRYWIVIIDGQQVRVEDLVGMRYLATLLTCPGTIVPALALAAQGVGVETVRHEVLDERARVAYTTRIAQLAADIAEADGDGDPERAASLRAEHDTLVAEVEAGTGLGGRFRRFPEDGERARTAVTKAIKRAIAAIDRASPVIADDLRDTVTTGTQCLYTPRRHRPIVWTTGDT